MVIEGYVERIVYANEDNGYAVIILSCDKKEITCTGYFQIINEGEYIEVEGDEVNHALYGKQIVVNSFITKEPNNKQAIIRYLGSGAIKGVGLIIAERIVRKFGEKTFDVIENHPEELERVQGISLRKAMEISDQIVRKRDLRKAMMFMQQYGITVGLSVKIYKAYGNRIYDILKTNPYQMADEIKGVGFKIADEIAKKTGIEINSSFRIKSGMLYALSSASSSGHTCLPVDELVEKTITLLDLTEQWKKHDSSFNFDILDNYFNELIMEGKIVRKEINGISYIFLSRFYYTEMAVARALSELDVPVGNDTELIEKKIKKIEQLTSIELDELQRKAVIEAGTNGLVIITGGPGTGKTTTIRTIIQVLESEGLSISLAAPTGRAAKRMNESTGMEASTIHRLLELKGMSEDDDSDVARFERNEQNPILSDVIIIDEMSMVDIFLINALLKAIPKGARLILVGDSNQLPSVGPGNVLKDIIMSGRFKVVSLNKIFRQSEESSIVLNAHKINKGEQIALDNKSGDFLYIARQSAMEVSNATVGLLLNKLPKYVNADPLDIQVLTPSRKGPLGVEVLNEFLQGYLNPKDDTKPEIKHLDTIFRVGDKVMQIKNNYQMEWERRTSFGKIFDAGAGVFNGDIGIIRRINHSMEMVEIEFEESRFAIYTFKQLDELELAYAVTIHKSQGSEYPAIIIPLLGGSQFLLNRNILYTAVTRAKKCVCIVGNSDTFAQMISNENQQKRYSSLRYQIEKIYEEETKCL